MLLYIGWRPFPNAVILGDSAYAARTWLMTPVLNQPLTLGARRYLRRLKSTRQLVERSLGVLKEKFPCLNHLRLRAPEACASIFLMCVTLHNIQNEFRHDEIEIDIGTFQSFKILKK